MESSQFSIDCDAVIPVDELDADSDGYVECTVWNDTQGDDPGIIDGENRFGADGDTKSAAFTAVDCYMRYTPSTSHDHLRARWQHPCLYFIITNIFKYSQTLQGAEHP